ncbi:MAG: ABC transporter ATP-binding protein [Sulfurifustis sp.]
MKQANGVIDVEGVSKLYRIGEKEQAHDSLSGAAIAFLLSPLRNYRRFRSLYRFGDTDETNEDTIWALRDVGFRVKEGEVLGIVGRNGAGKSTLLKILTRITPPTRGRVEIRGRVSSLLEVGTGFHQELTGRENIYLNGTILGMRKKEVDRKFDEIVEFAGMEKFLDTPVKRYSSGMAVRLAFAVAAHLEPEILIVDEVLAVGDAMFQKKCINKMHDVGKSGRTILFVSHNMPAVRMLCTRALLLNEGRLVMNGSPHDIVSHYMNSDVGIAAEREWDDPATAPGLDVAQLRAVRVVDSAGRVSESVDISDPIGLQMEYDVKVSGHILLSQFYVYNDEGLLLFGTIDGERRWQQHPRTPGRYISTAWIPGNLLTAGTFYVSCALLSRSSDTSQFYEQQVIAFHVTDNMGEGTARGDWAGWMGGVVRPLLEWETQIKESGRKLHTVPLKA